MIPFFRKIRKKMADDNKPIKYMRYAIGEIALVVIGILIALQINNWNEERKELIKVKTVLKSIHIELAKDSMKINEDLDFTVNEIELLEALYARVHQESATLDTIIKIARYEFRPYWVDHIDYRNNSFESAKSSGIFDMLPDSIKNELLELYSFQDYSVSINEKTHLQYQEKLDDITKTYSFQLDFPKEVKPLIIELSWQNVDSKHLVTRFRWLMMPKHVAWRLYIEELREVQKMTRSALKSIDLYLATD